MFFKLRLKKDLNEVTVKPSRIMFYHHGDTLVYNASAFVLAEGTMLDGLVKQLPGVNIDRNGVITCNGRRVEQLLLNGKDLFNGKNELMLENIGAYTVKNIAVYDKTGDISEMLGRKVAGDSKYVMDVRLKRQYMTGFMGNVDAGYGSDDSLGRAFAMWYSDNASVTAYTNVNNLSTERKPGSEDGSWSANDMGMGVSTRAKGGITYTVDGAMGKWKINGDVEGGYEKTDSRSTTTGQYYLPGGDTYSASWSRSISRSYDINTKHFLTLNPNRRTKILLFPSFSQSNRRTEGDILSASFSDNPGELSRDDVAGIYSGDGTLIRRLINRYASQQLDKGKITSAQFLPDLTLALNTPGGNRQGLRIQVWGNYDIHTENNREGYALGYAHDPIGGGATNQLTRRDPDRKWSVRPVISWIPYIATPKWLSSLSIYPHLEWSHSEEKVISNVYRLKEFTSDPAGNDMTLPSVNEFLSGFDPALSFDSRETSDKPSLSSAISLSLNKKGEDGKYKYMFSLWLQNIELTLAHRRFSYLYGNTPEHIRRSDLLFALDGEMSFHVPWLGRYLMHKLSFATKAVEAPFMQMVRLPQTNPLSVYDGNPDLKNGRNFRASYHTKVGDMSTKGKAHEINITYTTVTDALASGYIYDRNTGVRTYRTYNVNGNWTGDASYKLLAYLDKRHRFDLSATTAGGIVSSVDMIGSETDGEVTLPQRNIVNTYHVSEDLRFNYTSGRHRLTLHAEGRLNRYEGRAEGFSDFTSRTFKAGATAVLNLPCNWGVSTDFTVYGRGGFADSRLNTVEPVWNMRLTKSLMKGNIVIIADAYDLLRRLTNVNYMVNAQARTETVNNVIPAYILVHLQVRFNKKPPQR